MESVSVSWAEHKQVNQSLCIKYTDELKPDE